jgi:hypothetical protein
MRKTVIKSISLAAIGLAVYLVFGASCIPKTSLPVKGFLFNRAFHTTVDNELAKQMLTEPQSEIVAKLFSDFKNHAFNTATLSEIAAKNSMDVATLYFVQRAYKNEKNKEAQDLYLNYLDQLSGDDFKQQVSSLKDYYVAFVPGLDYNDTTNGGNFARQRRLFAANGIQNELILTGDWSLTDDNAAIVANRLKELSEVHEKKK